MFTGIVQAVQPVMAVETDRGIRRVRIKKPPRWKLVKGQSIAIDGICSTVVGSGKTFFDVEYMSETLRKTTADSFAKDRRVNLERSLRYGDYVDGHFVQGHIDARSSVVAIEDGGASRRITFAIAPEFREFVTPRGSVALNGVSLTVAQMHDSGFTVALIPYTLRHTNLGDLQEGSEVNIETDILARYPNAGLGATPRSRISAPRGRQ